MKFSRSRCLRSCLTPLLASLLLIVPNAFVVAKSDTLVGRKIPNFVLPDGEGRQTALADFADAKLLVVIFMGTQCPIGNAYVPDLVELQKRYANKRVQLLGINSNPADSAEEIARHATQYGINFPVLVDGEQLALDLFGADRTPDAFVLDRRRNVCYAGRIDDRVGYDFKLDKPRRADLEEAVKDLLAGRAVEVAETKSLGCKITRHSNLQARGEITYAKDIASILHKRCANCHHEDTAAPFSLLSYEEARDWSEMIHETIVLRRMPPWNADPRYGRFSNDLRMPKQEIDMLAAWIKAGAPFGNEADLPELPKFADGWQIGEPDLVFKMPQEYPVPATGSVEYQYFVTPTNLTEDVWVQKSEPRPGSRSLVHHIIVFVRPAGSEEMQRLPMLGGFAPGEEPIEHPAGAGFLLPAGSELVWQVHYTPTGKAGSDRSEIGLVLCKEPPQRAIHGGGIFNTKFRIPAGAENHRLVTSKKFNKDIELHALMPHMHVRGKDFSYIAHYPDGSSQTLLSVPDYDFNWQHRYRFEEPVRLPAGSTIECVAHYDNSAENPANPDPEKTVTWGDQTWEEMMIGWYSYVEPLKKESDL